MQIRVRVQSATSVELVRRRRAYEGVGTGPFEGSHLDLMLVRRGHQFSVDQLIGRNEETILISLPVLVPERYHPPLEGGGFRVGRWVVAQVVVVHLDRQGSGDVVLVHITSGRLETS